ncbi:MAG TPA: hypothetical protein VEJ63_04370 [Planctomycetota bacterium]|nr:hypothetical protein [Planctomycetota bacterium]
MRRIVPGLLMVFVALASTGAEDESPLADVDAEGVPALVKPEPAREDLTGEVGRSPDAFGARKKGIKVMVVRRKKGSCHDDMLFRFLNLKNVHGPAGRYDECARASFPAARYFLYTDVTFAEIEKRQRYEAILAFCKCCQSKGGRTVLFCSGRVQYLPNQDFKKALESDSINRGFVLHELQALDDAERRAINADIAALASEDYDERAVAFERLQKFGWRACSLLRLAMEKADDGEVEDRCRQLLAQYKKQEELNEKLLLEFGFEQQR